MKMFSDCSGPCVACVCWGGGCLAGHGDDDFGIASDDELIKRAKDLTRRFEEMAKDKNSNLIEVMIARQTVLDLINFISHSYPVGPRTEDCGGVK